MAERTLVIDHLKFSYEGLFNAGEIYNLISSFFFEKQWDWGEKLNQEMTTPTGRQIRLVLEPYKNISDYYKMAVVIKINFTDLKEVEVEQEGQALKLDHGLIRIIIDGYVVADRKGKWGDKPFYWLISVLAGKYFFREHFAKFETWVKSDVEELLQKIKNYLNVYKYTYQK